MLYGTTSFGGQYDRGPVYRMSNTGANFQVLYHFCPEADCPDGFDPNSLIYASHGNLYGTTLQGGFSGDTCTFFAYGCGTAFKISPSTGAFTLLHKFDPNVDGSSPFSITQASNGTNYGITTFNDYSPDPAQLFTISLSGDFGHLVTFPGPVAGGITEGPDGKIYGAADNDKTGFALFSVSLDGSGLQISNDAFGTYGATTPTLGNDGNYYLTSGTELGAHITIGGAIYKVSPAGQVLSTLNFDAGCSPTTPFVLTPSGTFLGTTVSGGEDYQPPWDLLTCSGQELSTRLALPRHHNAVLEPDPEQPRVVKKPEVLGFP